MQIAIGAMGGTIAMTSAQPGSPVTPTLGADQLVAAVPQLAQLADISATTLTFTPSPHLDVAAVRAAYDFALGAKRAGADGVVLTHGTDTLEETAYLLDLWWDLDIPIVITGAMRAPALPGADGPANLQAAVVAAASAKLRNLGVLVVLNDEVHAARRVQKTDATAVHTFASPAFGPLARIVEGEVYLGAIPPARLPALPVATGELIEIPIIEMALAQSPRIVELVANDPQTSALVLAASGVGHVSEAVAEYAGAMVGQGRPVVFATRTGAGPTLTRSYGYVGAEADLLARGLIGAGFLPARKARLLLHTLLAAGASMQDIRDEFAARN